MATVVPAGEEVVETTRLEDGAGFDSTAIGCALRKGGNSGAGKEACRWIYAIRYV